MFSWRKTFYAWFVFYHAKSGSHLRSATTGTLYYYNRDGTVASVPSDNWQVLDEFQPGEVPTFFYVPNPGFTTDDGTPPDSFSFMLEDSHLNVWRCQPTVLIYV